MSFELSVIVRNEEKRMTKKSLIYDECYVSVEDEVIKNAIDQAVKEFGDQEDLKIRVKINLEVQ